MADALFSIGQIGITGHLIINARKTTDPNTVMYTQTIAPPIGTTRNINFANIEPGVYYFDFRDSADGLSIGTLLNTYTVDVDTKQIVHEKRYYTVGGPRTIDPVHESTQLIDPFLEGKVKSFYKADRYLIPPDQPNPEWNNLAGGGIDLLSGLIFSQGEVVMAEVDYTIVQQTNNVQGIFAGTVDIASNTILNINHYNKLISCNSPSSRLVITLPQIGVIPDGRFFYFIFQAGTQFQVRFITQGADKILFAGKQLPEISIGRGEVLWIEKRAGFFRVLSELYGCLHVGENFTSNDIDHPNSLPCTGELFDGDDYPRVWYWIDKVLGTNNQIIDDGVNNANYKQPAGKETMWARTATTKKFRTPNKQGFYERGLDNMKTYAAGAYPGNTKNGQVGGHFHDAGTEADPAPKYNRSAVSHETRHWSGQNNIALRSSSTDINRNESGTYATKNEVDSSQIIYLVRI